MFAAIVRDTRGCALSDAERFNHFPASPLVAVTYVIEGETRLVPAGGGLVEAKLMPALAPVTVAGPYSAPLTSWNPGAVFAISIGFFPDAWSRLTGTTALAIANKTVSNVPKPLAGMPTPRAGDRDIAAFWEGFCDALEPDWQMARRGSGMRDSRGANNIADWANSLIARAAISGAGLSLRAAQRRLRRWAGQSKQSLAFYANVENLHRLAVQNEPGQLAGIAHDAGFSDQSHMGRTVRRATGFSPALLNRKIATDESFWCYRLMGERFSRAIAKT
ncbi:helix-turn-helix domain-containing protein [Dongia sp.]|uniref:helix-turn-helix domain-containing protein n=1 Tax=Dongia sp. TaxID=1977262 RepID=UPI0035B1595F